MIMFCNTIVTICKGFFLLGLQGSDSTFLELYGFTLGSLRINVAAVIVVLRDCESFCEEYFPVDTGTYHIQHYASFLVFSP